MRCAEDVVRRLGMAVVLAGLAGVALASDPVGVYARIDRVVMEPDDRAPERVQVWGVFSVAEASNRADYRPAQRGYLYFRLPEHAQAAQREWRDLQTVAGTRQIVAFGSRFQPLPTVRPATERAQSPDVYPINIGILKVNDRTGYAPIRALIAFKP